LSLSIEDSVALRNRTFSAISLENNKSWADFGKNYIRIRIIFSNLCRRAFWPAKLFPAHEHWKSHKIGPARGMCSIWPKFGFLDCFTRNSTANII
jgi:hypothetical protein